MSAVVHGEGIASQAAQAALRGLACDGLTLWVAPISAAAAPAAAIEALYLAPLRLAEALAARAPAPRVDATGEPAAQNQLILLVERRHLVPGQGQPAERAATAALLAWLEEAALTLAPRLRVNLLALPLESPPDLGPALAWLCGRAIVTGQVLKLGPPPPSTAPFRGDLR